MRGTTVPALVLLMLGLWAGALRAADEEPLAAAQRLVDAGRLEEALEGLDKLVKGQPAFAEAYLLRSTVRFMDGDLRGGRRDLDRALELDPELRQGWLNRAALALSEDRLDQALADLERARDLDPEAPDNGLNLGAVRALRGELDQATREFAEYLLRNANSAEAYRLVASNLAMAGHTEPALAHLERAVQLDERTRIAARTDPNFQELAADPGFQRLLNEDRYQPPPGARTAARLYEAPYEGGHGNLLRAVMNALQLYDRSFDPQVEVTAGWSLIWGDYRIKIRPETAASSVVELSAPGDRFTAGDWKRQTDEFFRDVSVELARLIRLR